MVSNFLKNLEGENIRYMSWKSNEHLDVALSGGVTDIDVLVFEKDKKRFVQRLEENGFVRATNSLRHDEFVKKEDWIGFNDKNGELIHMDVLTHLFVGQTGVKEFHLPWEEFLLTTRIKDSKHNVWVAHPAAELLLLLHRIVAKRTRFLTNGFSKEILYLLQSLDKQKAVENWIQIISREKAEKLWNIVNTYDNNSFLDNLKEETYDTLRNARRLSLINTQFYTIRAKCITLYKKIIRKLFDVNFSKRIVGGGTLIAFVGIDGSGKTTVTHDITQWLLWKIRTKRVYLGLVIKTRHLRLLASAIRYVRLRKAERLAQKGWIIITDRYPQSKYNNMNDGPSVTGRGAFFERLIYGRMMRIKSDKIVLMNIDPSEALKRRSGDIDYIEKKHTFLKPETYESTSTVSIDATQEREAVLLDAKHVVWNTIKYRINNHAQ